MVYILASEEVAKKYKVTISISGKDYNANYRTNTVSIDTPRYEVHKNKENSLPLTYFLAKKCISKDCNDADVLKFKYKVLKI
jgi:hypothetical protein